MEKKPKKITKNDDTDPKKKIDVQLRAINHLATRLPWIAVIITLLSMIFIFIELALRNG